MSQDITVTFLGTGAAVPSLRRAMPSVAIRRENEILLLDCGEATQQQILRAGLPPFKISAIFISHLHGDHVLGIPGFLTTQRMQRRTKELLIVGPQGIRDFVLQTLSLIDAALTFPINFVEIEAEKGGEYEIGSFAVQALSMEHKSPCLGYRFCEKEKRGLFDSNEAARLGIPEGPERAELASGRSVKIGSRIITPEQVIGPPIPGRVIAYCTDTRPCANAVSLAQNADLFICDSTFNDEQQEKAVESFHCTAREAGRMAKQAEAQKLALWHISTRHDESTEGLLLEQAQQEFENVVLPQDLDVLKISRQAEQR